MKNAQTCDYVRVQSATQWTASVHTLHMPDLRSCSKCYAMDCFGTYFTHAQACDYVRVQSATQWTASVHPLHMPKPVITFVFKVLRNGLLRYILYTCPCKPVITFVFKVLRNGLLRYILYTCQTYVRVQSATQWTASVHTLHMPDLRSCSKCYAMYCFGAYFTHAQACD